MLQVLTGLTFSRPPQNGRTSPNKWVSSKNPLQPLSFSLPTNSLNEAIFLAHLVSYPRCFFCSGFFAIHCTIVFSENWCDCYKNFWISCTDWPNLPLLCFCVIFFLKANMVETCRNNKKNKHQKRLCNTLLPISQYWMWPSPLKKWFSKPRGWARMWSVHRQWRTDRDREKMSGRGADPYYSMWVISLRRLLWYYNNSILSTTTLNSMPDKGDLHQKRGCHWRCYCLAWKK